MSDFDYQYRKLYGITEKDYDRMFAEQSGLCAICKKLDSTRLSVDHTAEKTGNVIRGLLCRECNLGLGKFQDSVELLNAAIEYLKRSPVIREAVPHKRGPSSTPRPRKTHCKRGHEYTEDNTHYFKNGKGRCCLACARMRYHLTKDRNCATIQE